LLNLLVFYVYINKIHDSRNKIPSKNLVRQRCAEGFHSGVEWLRTYINFEVKRWNGTVASRPPSIGHSDIKIVSTACRQRPSGTLGVPGVDRSHGHKQQKRHNLSTEPRG
jgi:hypothetical protein